MMRLTTRRLVTVGFATALFSGVGLAAAVAPGHTDHVSDVASPSVAEEPMPGGDATAPAAALGVLLTSAGLAWVVRRSAPSPHAVTETDVAPVADLSPRRPAGTKPRFRNPAAA